MASTNRIALVTGGNRGIGYAACEGLGKLGFQVLLTSRDLDKGENAAAALRKKGYQVNAHQLDVVDPASIEALRQTVEARYGRLDVLVNNAAVLLDEGAGIFELGLETIRETMETNFYGPLLMGQAFIPLMQQQRYGRVVNVSSEAGSLASMGTYAPSYSMSKAALNALTRVFAASVRGTDIKVNSMCPGWVRSDMGGPGAPRSLEQGAETILWLATLPSDGPTAGFFRDKKQVAW